MIENADAFRLAREEAVAWARSLLKCSDWAIVSTATSGLSSAAEIVEIAALDYRGEMVFETLIKPRGIIPATASAIHGITDDMVRNSPPFPQIASALFGALKDRRIIGYNVAFDARMLRQSIGQYNLPFEVGSAACLMRAYAKFWGERQGARGFRNQTLINACQQQRVAWETRRAGSKCQAGLALLFSMAGSAPVTCLPEDFLSREDLHRSSGARSDLRLIKS